MLTLVTATLDAASFIERALVSAATQRGPMQHIVVDGGSRDDTVAICRQHPHVDVIVAPGSSIYEAWNIGIERARGDAIMFLNADDELLPGAVESVIATLLRHPTADIVAGDAVFVDDDRPADVLSVTAAVADGGLDLSRLTAGVPAINAMAFRTGLFARHEHFETAYRVAGDRAFLVRLALSSSPPSVVMMATALYRYHVHAGSLTLKRGLTQRLRIARDHIDLAHALLSREIPAEAALWIKHMRRRDAAVATLRCLAAGRPGDAARFAIAIFA